MKLKLIAWSMEIIRVLIGFVKRNSKEDYDYLKRWIHL